MILLIDNYDSFTYSLCNLLSEIGGEAKVVRNDKISIDEVEKLAPEKIVLSPGPGHPANRRDFGVCGQILEKMQETPILGVCLGHQGIILHFGGKVVKNKSMHGKTSEITHSGKGLFSGVKNPLRVMRYHSLVGVDVPDCLEV
ncbi:MAG: anthranilate synthase component II, partial [Candidatus Anstonellaceae archaeon]